MFAQKKTARHGITELRRRQKAFDQRAESLAELVLAVGRVLGPLRSSEMRWRRFWQRKQRAEDLAKEMESYLAHEADLHALPGLSAEDAAWVAKRKLGNKMVVQERVWEMNSLTFLESVWQDLRYARSYYDAEKSRLLHRSNTFAPLGISANTAIFQC